MRIKDYIMVPIVPARKSLSFFVHPKGPGHILRQLVKILGYLDFPFERTQPPFLLPLNIPIQSGHLFSCLAELVFTFHSQANPFKNCEAE